MSFRTIVRSPDLLEQHAVGEHFVWMANENLEKLVFGGRQMDLMPIDSHPPVLEIHRQVPGSEDRLSALRRPSDMAQSNPKPRHELTYAEGLAQVIISTEIERGDFVDRKSVV